MRPVPLILLLLILAACSIRNGEQVGKQPEDTPEFGPRDCMGYWPLLAPVPMPQLLSPTIEERVAGRVGVARVTLESVSYDLPHRTRNNHVDLGYVRLDFAVLEHLKPRDRASETVSVTVDVGYKCEYIEDDDRDRESLAKMSADLKKSLDDKILILFLPNYYGFRLSGTVSYHDNQFGNQSATEEGYGLWEKWGDGSQWLMQAQGIGSDHNPHFVDPLDALYVDMPVNTISLFEFRERVKAVIAHEDVRGVECVGAYYEHQWHVRSGEESWYRGKLSEDGIPIECYAARPRRI